MPIDRRNNRDGSNWPSAIHFLLLIAALVSGALTVTAQFRLRSQWEKAPPETRNDIVLGMFGPTIHKVRASIPEQDGILLYSGVDPALLPYALFPRKIWQTATDPETNAIYMDLPPSSFPIISPEELPVSWQLEINQDNIMIGGNLTRTPPGRSR